MSNAEKDLKIKDANSLKKFLSNVFAEGIKSTLAQKALSEKEKQDAMSGDSGSGDSSTDDLFGADASSADDGGDEATSKTMDDETDKLKKGDIQPKDIVEKLNSI